MKYTNIDEIIPIITLGTLLINTIYFSIYYYQLKDETFKNYRNFLFFSFLYLFFEVIIISPKFSKDPIIYYVFSFSSVWMGYIYYIQFLKTAINLKKINRYFKFMKTALISGFVLNFISVLLPKFQHVYIWLGLAISFICFYFTFVILYNIRNKNSIYLRFIYAGSLLILVFNFVAIFFYESDRSFLGLSYHSIISIGYFLEEIMFFLAFNIKIKNIWDSHYKILNEKSELENQILLQKIERERANFVARYSERHQIAIDIHDGISNSVAGLKYYIEDKKIRSTDTLEKTILQDVEGELKSIYSEIRSYIKKLNHNINHENYNISEFLREMALQYKDARVDLQYSLKESDIIRLLNKEQNNELYFILKECIGNALKHSGCTKILVKIEILENKCSFKIDDDGIGIEIEIENQHEGLGIKNIKHRIKNLKGYVSFESSIGTTVFGYFPLIP